MKQLVVLILASALISCNEQKQIKSEIDHAYEVVDQGLKAIESDEYQAYLKKLSDSKHLEKKLLKQIESSKDQVLINASKTVVDRTYIIQHKLDSIVGELVAAYTLDDDGNFNNKRDKTRINRIMISEKKGAQLEEVIITSSVELKAMETEHQLSNSRSLNNLRSMLDTPNDKSWPEYNFYDMPVVAALPILRKIKNDAILIRVELLEGISMKTE